MPAPLGNKFALGKETGRKRIFDREQIAEDLVTWAQKDDSVNLCHFCATYKPPIAPQKLTLWAKEDDEFSEAYEIAKSFLGYRREQKLNKNELHQKAYDLNASTYDYFLKSERREQAEFSAQLNTPTDLQNINNLSNLIDKINNNKLSHNA